MQRNNRIIASKFERGFKMSIKEKVLKAIKRRWCSNAWLNRNCSFSGSTAERKLRELRFEGVKLKTRTKKAKIGKVTVQYLEFKVDRQ